MKKLFFTLLVGLLLSITNFSQTAMKIDEVGYLQCGDMTMRMDGYYQSELMNKPQNKLYVIYYEGKKRSVFVYNPKTKKEEIMFRNPLFGNALNRAKEIPLFLKMVYKVPNNRVVLIDGGFRESFGLEIWSVLEGSEIPKPTPTLTRKNIKFAKGKPQRTRKLACCYESC